MAIPLVAAALGGYQASRRAVAEPAPGPRRDAGVLAGGGFGFLVGVACLLAALILQVHGVPGLEGGGRPLGTATLWLGPAPLQGALFGLAWGVLGGALGGFLAGKGGDAADSPGRYGDRVTPGVECGLPQKGGRLLRIPSVPVDNQVMATIKLLIADDHGLVRQGLRRYLEMAGDIDVLGEASNGDRGPRMMENGTGEPDIVLLDIRMPEMDGLETARRIRVATRRSASSS